MALELACIESEWNLAEARAAFWQGRFEESRNGDASWEHQDVLFLEGAEGKLIAAVLVSRDPKWGDKIGFTLIEPGTTSNAQPMETLPKVLARFNRADPKVLPAPAKEQP